jgi:hypothetical protein
MCLSQAALERADESEERSRELQECNQRLEAHVHDLESRKRAPLYQKRQEEELRAALEKATEADARAHEAEMRAKEAKVRGRAWVDPHTTTAHGNLPHKQYVLCAESCAAPFSHVNHCLIQFSSLQDNAAKLGPLHRPPAYLTTGGTGGDVQDCGRAPGADPGCSTVGHC